MGNLGSKTKVVLDFAGKRKQDFDCFCQMISDSNNRVPLSIQTNAISQFRLKILRNFKPFAEWLQHPEFAANSVFLQTKSAAASRYSVSIGWS